MNQSPLDELRAASNSRDLWDMWNVAIHKDTQTDLSIGRQLMVAVQELQASINTRQTLIDDAKENLKDNKIATPNARGVIVQEPSEFTTTSPSQPSQLPQAKDKGNAKMVEPEKPLMKKDRIMFDKEVAQKLQAQLDVELEKEEKLAKKREEDANIAEWDDVQAIMMRDYN
ncbi:hypothetical protein Tco_0568766 [Tanacetum coccineum]